MIIVCEPQCKGISHEKVNAGFLYGLHLAYPKKVIKFFSEKTHFREIKDIFKSNNITTKDLVNEPIIFNPEKSFSLRGIISYYFLIKRIFDRTLLLGQKKIFFLSTNPIILYVIKKLKQRNKYKDMNCTFVLHGELEDIANKDYKELYVPVIKGVKTNLNKVIITLINHPARVFQYAIKSIFWPLFWIHSKYTLIFKKKFRTKTMMMWRHSDQYKYISLSPHVTKNASKYLDVKYLNFYTIIMPIIFSKKVPQPINKYIKFAVFGYGDSSQMQKMLTIISKRKIAKPYEIRIISMDDRGTDGFKNITHVGNGNVLTRKEMENSARDIDVFINLYDITRHRLGCSLSIFEAFSYLKPVLHLGNPGYNYFNKFWRPIGYRCENLESFVNKMCNMIENYPKYKKKIAFFRKNMLIYRKKYHIKNNLDNLRKSHSF